MISQILIPAKHLQTQIRTTATEHPFAATAVIVYILVVWPALFIGGFALILLGASVLFTATLLTLAFAPLLLFCLQGSIVAWGPSLAAAWAASRVSRFFSFQKKKTITYPKASEDAIEANNGFRERAQVLADILVANKVQDVSIEQGRSVRIRGE